MPLTIGQKQAIPSASGGGRPQMVFVGGTSAMGLFRWFNFDGLTFEQLPQPSVMPIGTVRHVHASKDGKRVAVVSDGASNNQNLRIYNMDVSAKTLTLSGITPTTHVAAGRSVAWSNDGNFLAVGFNAAPFLRVYRINSDNTVTECTLGSFPGLGAVLSLAWSPDDLALAIAGAGANGAGGGLQVCNRASTAATNFTTRTLTSKSDSAESRGAGWLANNVVVFSSTVNDAAGGGRVQGFTRSGNTFSRVLSGFPNTEPPINARGLAIYPGGTAFCVGMAGDPFVTAYNFTNGTGTSVATRMTPLETTGGITIPRHTDTVSTPRFSADGLYAFTQAVNDGVRAYRVNINGGWGGVAVAPSTVGSSCLGTWPSAEFTVMA